MRCRNNPTLQDRVRPVRPLTLGDGAGKSPVLISPILGVISPCRQFIEHELIERHGFLRRFGFARTNSLALRVMHYRASDIGLLFWPVDVSPLERHHFATTKTRARTD